MSKDHLIFLTCVSFTTVKILELFPSFGRKKFWHRSLLRCLNLTNGQGQRNYRENGVYLSKGFNTWEQALRQELFRFITGLSISRALVLRGKCCCLVVELSTRLQLKCQLELEDINLEKYFSKSIKKIFFNVFGCTGFQLRYTEFLVLECELLVAAYGIQLPDQGLNPGPWHWERGVLATGSPGKSLSKPIKRKDWEEHLQFLRALPLRTGRTLERMVRGLKIPKALTFVTISFLRTQLFAIIAEIRGVLILFRSLYFGVED